MIDLKRKDQFLQENSSSKSQKKITTFSHKNI